MHRLRSTTATFRVRAAAAALPGFRAQAKAAALFALLLLLLAAALLAPGCASGVSEANRLVGEGESLRASAIDTFRRTTAAVDTLVRNASAGRPLTQNEVKAVTDTAVQDLNSALAGLAERNSKLNEAQGLGINDNYKDYLSLLKQSNNKLIEALNRAMEIPELLKKEQRSLAGWDEIKAQQILNQISVMEQSVEKAYAESETLRIQAEQIRKDNPGDFGG